MITLEPYQQRAVDWLTVRRKGIVQIPAGGGKTIVAASALNQVAESNQLTRLRIGWIAPTVETREQGLAAMKLFPGLAVADIKAACVSPEVDMSDRHILIVDECKHAPAESWKRIVEQCPVRWGLDATPFNDDADRTSELLQMFGNEILKVERHEVKRLVKACVRMLDASDPVREKIDREIKRLTEKREKFSRLSKGELFSMAAWQACAQLGIAENHARNNAIIRTARDHAFDQVLILVNQVEHGEALARQIDGARLVHSKLGKKLRREILDSVRSGDCSCLIATSLADEGLDLPSLNVLILASGGRSKIKAEQRTGRVLRAFAGKDHGLIYDFVDSQHPVMASQSRKRVTLYKTLGYQIESYVGKL